MPPKKPSGFASHPGYKVEFLPTQKRVRVTAAGETLADSTQAYLMRETGHTPVYYFPREHVNLSALKPSPTISYCPFKGDASYWHVMAGDQRIEDAVWSYRDPYPETAEIKDTLAFYWNKMEAWYEEDEQVFVHARDPAVRIDILFSERHLKVELNGTTLAESKRALFLFETGLPVRYYLPPEDVNSALLTASRSSSDCPYKGRASYFDVTIGAEVYSDLVWHYESPLPEVARIKDHLCIFNERVDAITLDNRALLKPVTKWS